MTEHSRLMRLTEYCIPYGVRTTVYSYGTTLARKEAAAQRKRHMRMGPTAARIRTDPGDKYGEVTGVSMLIQIALLAPLMW